MQARPSRIILCVSIAATVSVAAAACAARRDAPLLVGSAAPSIASGAHLHLRAENGLYVVAELGGGGAVNANRAAAGPWETYTLIDVGGPPLRTGDDVRLQTSDGVHFLGAVGGGGHAVWAGASAAGAWETFTLLDLDGHDEITTGDRVALRASNERWVVAEEGGGGVVNANRNAVGPWETFTLLAEGTGRSDVVENDTTLVLPAGTGPVLGTVTGYEMSSGCPFDDATLCEVPLLAPYDRSDPAWWNNLVDELLTSRVHVVMAHGRGCFDPLAGDAGNGNMCPRLLRHMVDAIGRAGAGNVMRLGMFDDTGAYPGARNIAEGLPPDTRFDLADRSAWRFFWDYNMRVWFDTIPPDSWFRLDGRPVVAFWSLADAFFVNQAGNARALLQTLRSNFQARYGENPIFIVDQTWVEEDPTITVDDAQGVNAWFNPPTNNYTYRSWNGAQWGAAVPGFRDPNHRAGCGPACREVDRRDGAALEEALVAGTGARFVLLEGWTDVAESAGYYRSDAWRFPNQYIGIVREFADPGTPSLRLQAEAADRYFDASAGNFGASYRGGDLDVGLLADGSGWFVGWTDPGEWIEFAEVALACGTYRFSGRLSAPTDGRSVRLEIDGGSLGDVAVPATSDWDRYDLVHLGAREISAGHHDLRIVFETGAVNLDWIFVRRVSARCSL